MRSSLPLMLVLAIGCATDEDGGDDTDLVDTDTQVDTDEGPTTVPLETFVNVTAVSHGDLTCVPEDGTSWWTQDIDESCIELAPLQGTMEDFQTQGPAVGIDVEIWFDDDVEGEPDVTASSDVEGVVTGGDVPTCTPFASRATNPSDPTAPPAIQMHWSESHKTPMDAYFNSVDSSTLGLMSALLGVQPDTTKAFAAGTIYDCAEGRDEIEGVQVVLRSEDGTYTAHQTIHYFVNGYPNREQPYTSADGLFLIVNVPPGKYTVEAYAVLAEGEDPTLIAMAETRLLPGSLTVTEIYSGNGTGVVLPDSCTAACEPFPQP